MNLSLLEIYRFFLGYNFSIGIKIGLGVFLPLVIFLQFDMQFSNILAFGFGAVIVSISDQIGPMKHRRNEMLGTWLSITLIAFIASSLHKYNILSGIFTVFITFIGSLMASFGKKGSSIGFAFIFAAIISVKQTDSVLIYTVMTSMGALTYSIYALILAHFWQKKTTRQSLADTYFLLARYLRALSKCYRQNNQLDESYQNLMQAQADLLEGQQKIRDVLYRKQFTADADYLKMANELSTLIDIQEKLTTPFQDFRGFRTHFANSDIQIFFRDLTKKAASNLEEISLHTLGGTGHIQRLGFKAELRALEYEIEIKKREKLDILKSGSYQLLVGHFRKYWSITRQIEKLRKLHIGEIAASKHLPGQFSKFITHQTWAFSTLKDQFNTTASIMRHAIRTSFAMAFGLIIVANSPFLNHGFWIAFTIVTLMSPGFSITWQKTRDRIIGTVVGCFIGGIIIGYQLSAIIMISILFTCMVLSNGLSNLRLDISVAFNTIYVLILSNYQYPTSDIMLTGERILTTLFGAFIAISFSYLLPSWERFEVSRLKTSVRKSIQKIVACIDAVWFNKNCDAVEYRLSRRAAQIAIAEATNCYQRMQREPKKYQGNLEDLSYFISRNQSILSQFMLLSAGLDQLHQDPKQLTEFYELFLIIKMIIDDQTDQTLLNPDFNPINPLSAQEIKPLVWQIDELIAHQNNRIEPKIITETID